MGIFEDYFDGKNFIVAGMGTGQGMPKAKLIENEDLRVGLANGLPVEHVE